MHAMADRCQSLVHQLDVTRAASWQLVSYEPLPHPAPAPSHQRVMCRARLLRLFCWLCSSQTSTAARELLCTMLADLSGHDMRVRYYFKKNMCMPDIPQGCSVDQLHSCLPKHTGRSKSGTDS